MSYWKGSSGMPLEERQQWNAPGGKAAVDCPWMSGRESPGEAAVECLWRGSLNLELLTTCSSTSPPPPCGNVIIYDIVIIYYSFLFNIIHEIRACWTGV